MLTIGQLVSDLFSKYERQFGDEQVAAIATQVTIDEVLRNRNRNRNRAAQRKVA